MGLRLVVFAVTVVVIMSVLLTRSFDDAPMNDPQSVALINEMNSKVAVLLRHMRRSPRLMEDVRVRRLLSRFGNKKILSMPPGRGAAYTVNKGQEVRMCTDGDIETGTFVMLHELAHIMTETNGHDHHFWVNFAFVLRVAVDAGVYQSQNFTKDSPGSYCGKTITYQPLENGGQRALDDHYRRVRGWK